MNLTNFNANAAQTFEYTHIPDDEPSGYIFRLEEGPFGSSTFVVSGGSDYVSIRQGQARISLHSDAIEGLAALLPKIRKLQKVAK